MRLTRELLQMANLTFLEKRKLGEALGMSGGYVLDFSNQTISEFVRDSVGKNIYDATYAYESGSKANRLRAFWNQEPNHIVAKLLADLLSCARNISDTVDVELFQRSAQRRRCR